MSSFKLSDSEKYAKSLVRLAVHKTGSARLASEWTGIQESELSRYASDDHDRHIPFHRVIELDEAAGDIILKAWLRRRGYEVVSIEQREELALNLNKLIGQLAHDEANLTSAAIDVAADGKATPNEIKRVENCVGDVIVTAESIAKGVAQLKVVS